MPSTKPLSFIECETRNGGGAFVSLNLLLSSGRSRTRFRRAEGAELGHRPSPRCERAQSVSSGRAPSDLKGKQANKQQQENKGVGWWKKQRQFLEGLANKELKWSAAGWSGAVGSRGAAGGRGLRAELLGQPLGAGDVSSCPAAPFLAFGALWHSGAADPVGLLGWYAGDWSEAEKAALLGVIWCDLNETAVRGI